MKFKSYIKAILSGLVWGLGQIFNRQYLKALLFFAVFVLFVGIELGTSKYFDERTDTEMAFDKINGEELGDTFFAQIPRSYRNYLRAANVSGFYLDSKGNNVPASLIQSDSFEQFLSDNEINEDPNGENTLTEELFIQYLAAELKAISSEEFTDLSSGLEVAGFVVDEHLNNIVNFSETLYWDQVTDKFYAEVITTNVVGDNVSIFVERNLFLNNGDNVIEDPEILETKDNLVLFSKKGIVKKYNETFYLEVEIQRVIDKKIVKETANIEINSNNELTFYTGTASLDVIGLPNGELYFYNNTLVERYLPGLYIGGKYTQYKQSNIMFTFREVVLNRVNIRPGSIREADIYKFQFKVFLGINPEIEKAFLENQINFFSNRGGLFLKGYWQVISLGSTTSENITAHNALANNIRGINYAVLEDTNLEISADGSIQILGHVSTMFLIEGLIAIILSLFFFIFMIWSIIDAYKTSEKIRKEEKVETTKEYFKSVWDNGFEYIVLSPALFVLAFISIMPIVFGFLLAFTSISGGASMNAKFDYVGLRNFFALFNFQSGLGATFGKAFWSVLLWTIIWAVFSTGTVFFGGFIQALILNSEKVVFRKLWRTILILPWAIPALLSQMVFSVIFGDNGFINELFRDIGLYQVFQNIGILGPYDQVSGILKYFWLGEQNIQWFSNPFNTGFVRTTLIVVNIWLGFPYFMALMTGIMTAIDKTLYEAADIDGATGLQKTMKITIPLVLYSTAPILIMTFSGNFNNFGVIYFITGGGPGGSSATGFAGNTDILISWMYKLTVDHSVYNMASVFSVLIFLVVGSVTAWNLSKTRAFQGD